jgi:hypothetical protein
VTALGFSAAMTASISSGILAGAEVVLFLAVAVMGNSGYAYIKNRVFSFLKQYGPPAGVSRTRYIVGLGMFVVPFLLAWLAPYSGHLMPGYARNELTFAIVGDLLLLVSLFVLGGDFWDKLKALFIYDVRARNVRKRAPSLPTDPLERWRGVRPRVLHAAGRHAARRGAGALPPRAPDRGDGHPDRAARGLEPV